MSWIWTLKDECSNARAFTQKEWVEINSRVGPKAMLVTMEGKEEVVMPPTPVDGPKSTYVVNSLGTMELTGTELSEESNNKQINPEKEGHSLLVRRNFHATSKAVKTNQRENIFQTKCGIGGDLCDLIIDSGSELN